MIAKLNVSDCILTLPLKRLELRTLTLATSVF
ncbi:hypothetical protein EMIT048CA2_90100 [Pseudomonas chlororaphis]